MMPKILSQTGNKLGEVGLTGFGKGLKFEAGYGIQEFREGRSGTDSVELYSERQQH